MDLIVERFLNADLSIHLTGTRIGGSEAMKYLSIFQKLKADDRGATAIEYGLILAMVFLAMVGAVQAFGIEVTEMFDHISTTSVSAMQGG
jgi:pilus assembly protein Flp/PilA